MWFLNWLLQIKTGTYCIWSPRSSRRQSELPGTEVTSCLIKFFVFQELREIAHMYTARKTGLKWNWQERGNDISTPGDRPQQGTNQSLIPITVLLGKIGSHRFGSLWTGWFWELAPPSFMRLQKEKRKEGITLSEWFVEDEDNNTAVAPAVALSQLKWAPLGDFGLMSSMAPSTTTVTHNEGLYFRSFQLHPPSCGVPLWEDVWQQALELLRRPQLPFVIKHMRK